MFGWHFGQIRKWIAGLTTTALIVLAVAAFLGFSGIIGGNPVLFLIGAGIAGGWWWFEYRREPAEPEA